MSSVTDIQLDPDEAKDLCVEIAPVGTFAMFVTDGSARLVGSPSDNAGSAGLPISLSGDPLSVVVSSPDTLYVKNTSSMSSATVRVHHNR